MSQFYIDPRRGNDAYALPNGEAFYVRKGEWYRDPNGERCDQPTEDGAPIDVEGFEPCAAGWYWWPCFPGCLPDGEPMGPFETEAEAIANAREDLGE